MDGHIALVMGDLAAAAPQGREAERWARATNDLDMLGHALFVVAGTKLSTGDLSAARQLYAEGADTCEAAGNYTLLAMTLATQVMVAAFTGRHEEAVSLAEKGFEVCERHREHWARAYILYALALTQWTRGFFDEAISNVEGGSRIVRSLNDLLGAGMLLELRAWIAGTAGDPERSAEILGVAEKVWPSVGGRALLGSLAWIGPHDECERVVRATLGESAFQAAFQRGADATESLSDAVAVALGERRSQPAQDGAVLSPLSVRESQVAELVAQGLTNKEIASRLMIAVRTADAHVNHALAKLGFTSRTQIAAWVVERQMGSR